MTSELAELLIAFIKLDMYVREQYVRLGIKIPFPNEVKQPKLENEKQ